MSCRIGYTVDVVVQVTCNSDVSDRLRVLRRGMEKKINIRKYDDGSVSESCCCLLLLFIVFLLTVDVTLSVCFAIAVVCSCCLFLFTVLLFF